MARRNQFKGICHDLLESFVSRYNDHNGYWSLGHYVALLERLGKSQIQIHLTGEAATSEIPLIAVSEEYYRRAVFSMMEAHSMPKLWLRTATITVLVPAPAKARCDIEIVSDLGKTYRSERTLTARPHDPGTEVRRRDSFGPSNQKQHLSLKIDQY
ncbi:hypothetical protein [Rhizobium paknamense]|uniref:Uncharacterized protein n=1 Tax=Rhizobium paknamense TaxID=1206817 RepID=A0ABU0I804_9HYPH|nr:hypothetical protein [Rhizobium paknamense]MDQ0454350.1 hypothetical protein [Rhizobium paknamense]